MPARQEPREQTSAARNQTHAAASTRREPNHNKDMPSDPFQPIAPDDPPPTPPRHRSSGRWLIALLVLLLVAGAAWYYWGRSPSDANGTTTTAQGNARSPNGKGGGGAGGFGGGRRSAAGPDTRTVMPVTVVPARSQDFPVYLSAIGNVTAKSTVTVRPRVDGQLSRVLFREGQIVKAGDLLAEIDPRPFEVMVLQAQGQLARDQAMLQNARVDLDRYQTLFKQDSIAQQQVATQEALVRQLEGTIEADRGNLESAKLQLSFTKIVAPAGGRLGLRQVDPGNMVHQTDTNGIVVITQIQPIGVVYSIPEDQLGSVLHRSQGGEALPVDAYDRDGKTRIATGKLLTIDNQIDPTTGTVKLKAEFANENAALFPNQFVNTRLLVTTEHNVTLIPSYAIQHNGEVAFVYVIKKGTDHDGKPEYTAHVQNVKAGTTDAGMTAVEGINPGDDVATSSYEKLQDGSKVTLSRNPIPQNPNGESNVP